MTKRKVYIAPKANVIADYAQGVCRELSAEHDASLSDPQVVSGFSDFLRVVSEAVAKQLNRDDSASFDNSATDS